jgi:hypothetical protein
MFTTRLKNINTRIAVYFSIPYTFFFYFFRDKEKYMKKELPTFHELQGFQIFFYEGLQLSIMTNLPQVFTSFLHFLHSKMFCRVSSFFFSPPQFLLNLPWSGANAWRLGRNRSVWNSSPSLQATTWRRAFLQLLIVAHIIKEFHALGLYERLVTVFTAVYILMPHLFQINLNIRLPLLLSFLQIFLPKFCTRFSFVPCMLHDSPIYSLVWRSGFKPIQSYRQNYSFVYFNF